MRALFTYDCNKTYGTRTPEDLERFGAKQILAFEFTSCCGASMTTVGDALACRKCYGKIDEFIYDDVIAFLPFFNEQDAWRNREPYDTPASALIRQAKEFISALDDYVNLKGDFFRDRQTGEPLELHK